MASGRTRKGAVAPFGDEAFEEIEELGGVGEGGPEEAHCLCQYRRSARNAEGWCRTSGLMVALRRNTLMGKSFFVFFAKRKYLSGLESCLHRSLRSAGALQVWRVDVDLWGGVGENGGGI